MAHPKSKISKQRKRKRRTNIKVTPPNVSICPTTGEPHLFHRAYEVDGNTYYRGQLFIKADEDIEE